VGFGACDQCPAPALWDAASTSEELGTRTPEGSEGGRGPRIPAGDAPDSRSVRRAAVAPAEKPRQRGRSWSF